MGAGSEVAVLCSVGGSMRVASSHAGALSSNLTCDRAQATQVKKWVRESLDYQRRVWRLEFGGSLHGTVHRTGEDYCCPTECGAVAIAVSERKKNSSSTVSSVLPW